MRNKGIFYRFFCVFLWASASFVIVAESSASSGKAIKIKLAEPEFVLPRFTGRFREREASIAPEEYEIAEELRVLLDEGKKQEVLERLKGFYDLELSVAMLTLKAQIYFSLEMFTEAEKLYLSALSRKPQLVRAHSDLGQLYLLTDRPQKARQYFSNAVAYGANDAVIHGQLGYLNLTQYGPFTAISEYQQASALEPDNIVWQQGLLAALTQAKMYQSAGALITEMLARKPDNIELWLNQAAISMEQNMPQQALAALEMAILLGEKDRENIKAAVQLHFQANSFVRAVELINKGLINTDTDMAMVHEYVSWLEQAEMWREAQDVLDGMASSVVNLSDKEQSLYSLHRAKVLHKQGKMDAAEASFKKSVALDATNGLALVEFAGFYAGRGHYAESEILYLRAEGVPPVEKAAMLGKAQLYIDMRDFPAALQQLRQIYTRYPDQVALQDNIAILENIIRSNNQN